MGDNSPDYENNLAFEPVKVIALRDGITTQAELPLQGGEDNYIPTWEELEQLYRAKKPDATIASAIFQIQLTAERALTAHKAAPIKIFREQLARLYVDWIGLMGVVNSESGIGEESLNAELRKLWRERLIK